MQTSYQCFKASNDLIFPIDLDLASEDPSNTSDKVKPRPWHEMLKKKFLEQVLAGFVNAQDRRAWLLQGAQTSLQCRIHQVNTYLNSSLSLFMLFFSFHTFVPFIYSRATASTVFCLLITRRDKNNRKRSRVVFSNRAFNSHNKILHSPYLTSLNTGYPDDAPLSQQGQCGNKTRAIAWDPKHQIEILPAERHAFAVDSQCEENTCMEIGDSTFRRFLTPNKLLAKTAELSRVTD